MAAAVLVAARLGAAISDPPAQKLLESHPFEVTAELRALALRTLDRLADPRDNEWHDLWSDADRLDEVMIRLRPYRGTLNEQGQSRV